MCSSPAKAGQSRPARDTSIEKKHFTQRRKGAKKNKNPTLSVNNGLRLILLSGSYAALRLCVRCFLFHLPNRVVQSVQRLVDVAHRHRGAKAVVAGGAAVVVVVDAVADRGRDEAQHRFA